MGDCQRPQMVEVGEVDNALETAWALLLPSVEGLGDCRKKLLACNYGTVYVWNGQIPNGSRQYGDPFASIPGKITTL